MPDEQKLPDKTEDGAGLPLYGLFLLTGVGTALLGATLPVMLVHWRLTDASAGVLFLLLFIASSSGSLASRAASGLRAGSAGLVLALCCGALAFAHGRAVFPLTVAYGFALGFSISTVTRVRLLCSPQMRVREVNRLNLVWGLGAFLCPSIANEILRRASVHALFFALGAMFLVSGAAILQSVWTSRRAHLRGVLLMNPEEQIGKASLPWLVAAGAFLAVGLESSLGAWLATYAHRLASGFAAPVEATTLFWLGLLASRAVCSTAAIRRFTERELLLSFLLITAAGSVALVSSQRGEVVLAASLAAGFGVGPLFPLLLAAVLPRVRGNAIFVIAGMGASVLPWLTGEISSQAGSLRMGLATTALAGVLLLACGWKLVGKLEGLTGRVLPSEAL